MTTKIEQSLELRRAIRAKYAWPGGYPMFIAMADGGCLCMDCARQNYRLIADSNRHDLRDGWRTDCVGINWEDDQLVCDNCYCNIESAYGGDDGDSN